ncbi:hypothetical protein HDU76_000997, partial [Blyttiomyces sp. JEL0837]
MSIRGSLVSVLVALIVYVALTGSTDGATVRHHATMSKHKYVKKTAAITGRKCITTNLQAHYCVDISLDPKADIANITVSTDQTGWAGVGIGGNEMVGPLLFVGWYNDSGYPVVSERQALYHALPPLVENASFVILDKTPSN